MFSFVPFSSKISINLAFPRTVAFPNAVHFEISSAFSRLDSKFGLEFFFAVEMSNSAHATALSKFSVGKNCQC